MTKMSRIRRTLVMALAAAICIVSVSYSNVDAHAKASKKITMRSKNLVINEDDYYLLEADNIPKKAKVSCTSADTKIADLKKEKRYRYMVVGTGEGNTTLTYKIRYTQKKKKKTKTFKVSVQVNPGRIKFNPDEITIRKGQTQRLLIDGFFYIKDVTCTSDNESVATGSRNAYGFTVTGNSEGTANVTFNLKYTPAIRGWEKVKEKALTVKVTVGSPDKISEELTAPSFKGKYCAVTEYHEFKNNIALKIKNNSSERRRFSVDVKYYDANGNFMKKFTTYWPFDALEPGEERYFLADTPYRKSHVSYGSFSLDVRADVNNIYSNDYDKVKDQLSIGTAYRQNNNSNFKGQDVNYYFVQPISYSGATFISRFSALVYLWKGNELVGMDLIDQTKGIAPGNTDINLWGMISGVDASGYFSDSDPKAPDRMTVDDIYVNLEKE